MSGEREGFVSSGAGNVGPDGRARTDRRRPKRVCVPGRMIAWTNGRWDIPKYCPVAVKKI